MGATHSSCVEQVITNILLTRSSLFLLGGKFISLVSVLHHLPFVVHRHVFLRKVVLFFAFDFDFYPSETTDISATHTHTHTHTHKSYIHTGRGRWILSMYIYTYARYASSTHSCMQSISFGDWQAVGNCTRSPPVLPSPDFLETDITVGGAPAGVLSSGSSRENAYIHPPWWAANAPLL